MTSYAQVRVLSVTHIHPDHHTKNLTTPPPPHGDHTIKLSFLDSCHVSTGPIQRLFFYEGPDLPPFPSIVRSLKSSLAAILPVFLPLAGKLAFRAPTADVVLDFSPSAIATGVEFLEAEFSGGGVDAMRRLAGDDEHDTEAFVQLVPDLVAGHQLPAPVLAVQVTRPAAGDGAGAGAAVAVGVSIHHAVADGKSLWQFMTWWSAASREALLTAPLLVPPTFDRTAIRHPKAEELAVTSLRMLAPTLPLLRRSSSRTADAAHPRRRTFLLSACQIQSLKRRISLHAAAAQLSKPASTYVAVSSLAWTCIVRAKSLSHADDAYLMVNADCRGRLRHPPLGEGFFGNCIKPCYARAKAGDLLCRDHDDDDDGGGLGLARAAAAIQEAIHEYVDEMENPFSDFEALLKYHVALPPERLAVVGSSHRFMAYGTDFGWGAPSRVELVSIFGNKEMVLLLGAKEDGNVQVSVSLDAACVDGFAANFVRAAGGARQASSAG